MKCLPNEWKDGVMIAIFAYSSNKVVKLHYSPICMAIAMSAVHILRIYRTFRGIICASSGRLSVTGKPERPMRCYW
jgi:hypothetical protein